MANQSQQQTLSLKVPPEIQEKFGSLVELISNSESMNDEERQYWVNILAVMTPEQIQNLTEILTNEKEQLKAIDAKYAKESAAATTKDPAALGEAIRSKKKQREEIENADSEKEEKTEEELLGKIQAM